MHTLARKLDEKIAVLPRSLTPPVDGDALSSPDVTPPRVEDITSPQRKDNVEAVDMDMSDDDALHETTTADSMFKFR